MEQQISEQLNAIYEALMQQYGPQAWWPGETAFEVVVGAILTQSTAWENASKAISNLKAGNWLSVKAICNLQHQELAEIIRPSGYFNAKAKKLKSMAGWLESTCGGNIKHLASIDTWALRSKLLNIYGIGPETADSILLYGLEKPVFVIDAYTRRIFSRLGLTPVDGTGYDNYQQFFMHNLKADATLYNEYHALLVKLAKDSCRKQPICHDCCLARECKRYAQRESSDKQPNAATYRKNR